MVGGPYTNAKKQTQTVDLFSLIIVLVPLRVATGYLDIVIYVLDHRMVKKLSRQKKL